MFIIIFIYYCFIISHSVPKFFFRFGLQNPVGLAMLDIVKETIEHREKHGIVRKDMMQLLMQLRNNGSIDEDDTKIWSMKTTADGRNLFEFNIFKL